MEIGHLYNCSYLSLDNNTSDGVLCLYNNFSVYEASSSNSSNDYENDPTSQAIVSYVVRILYASFFVAGVIGNLTVLFVVTKYSKLKSVTNFYIINLAMSDLLFLLDIPFLMTTYTYEYWIFGNLMCKFYMVNTSLNQFTSSLFLTIMSADRYVAVCHPINSPRYRTPLISRLVAITAWTLASLMTAPVFMYATTFQAANTISCNIFWPTSLDVTGTHMFIVYSFCLSFAAPLILIFTFYSLVIWKLKTSQEKSKLNERRRPKRSRVTRLVMTLIAVYVFCYLPYWTLQLVLLTDEPAKAHRRFIIICFQVTAFLSYANSAINPILYTFLSDNFQNSFKEACGCLNPISYMRRNRSMNFMCNVDGKKIKNAMRMKELGRDEIQLAGLCSEDNRLSGSSNNGRQQMTRADANPEKNSGTSIT